MTHRMLPFRGSCRRKPTEGLKPPAPEIELAYRTSLSTVPGS
jgi:hypothetical protein